MAQNDWIVFGSELSPFTLKLLAMCRLKSLPHRFFPTEGSTRENLAIQWRKARLVAGRLPLTWPEKTDEDEYPLVPFLFGPQGENLYDSSAIAGWLDDQIASFPLIPDESPALAYVACLIDEYADEFGLYMVHHNRWKYSAISNNAGARLSREMPAALGQDNSLMRRQVGTFFSARQTRRLPYLFSVAPQDYRISSLPKRRQPPAKAGFPATHDLLEQAFENLLHALEPILSKQDYILGERMTLADASLYGQLGMNLTDPDANHWIRRTAPNTHAWLERIHHGRNRHSVYGKNRLNDNLKPLLAEICRVFVPLMQQNYHAYDQYRQQGETVFNEEAFDQGRCLYDGEIDGMAYRNVAKSFQAKVWRQLVARWDALNADCKLELLPLLPGDHGLGRLDGLS